MLFLVGWFASGGDAPDYGASDQDWTAWADDNQWKSRIGAFAMLLAGFVFLHFAATIRTGSEVRKQQGHLPYLYAGSEVVEFSPSAELQETMAVVERNMQAASA